MEEVDDLSTTVIENINDLCEKWIAKVERLEELNNRLEGLMGRLDLIEKGARVTEELIHQLVATMTPPTSREE